MLESNVVEKEEGGNMKVLFEQGEDGMIHIKENIVNSEVFKRKVCYPYFKDVFEDLLSRSDQPTEGINNLSFLDFIDLHGLLGERIFKVFDLNEDGYIDKQEFLDGMYKLYYSDFDVKMRFIFDIYDFDLDGEISKEDIRTILCQLPLNQMITDKEEICKEGKFTTEGGGGEGFNDRIESMEELLNMTEAHFRDRKTLNFNTFKIIIENESSDMFLSKKLPAFEQFRQYEKKLVGKIETSPGGTKRQAIKLASPKYLSKCSPIASMILDSPFNKCSNKKITTFTQVATMNVLNKYRTKKPTQAGCKENIEIEGFEGFEEDTGDIAEEKTSKIGIINSLYNANSLKLKGGNTPKDRSPLKITSGVTIGNMKELDLDSPMSPLNTECIRLPNKTKVDLNSLKAQKLSKGNIVVTRDITSTPTKFLKGDIETSPVVVYCECGKLLEKEKLKCPECSSGVKNPVHKGFLYLKKHDLDKIKKYWYYLLNKELYCYKTPQHEVIKHKRMHSLVGCFIKEEPVDILQNKFVLYPFSIYIGKKVRTYYCNTMEAKNEWVAALKSAIGYHDLFDYYEIGGKLGNGKFGIVRSAIHKKTQQKVAVKVLKKKEMTLQEQELVRREIEIMKICQHPNIIRMLDVFENHEVIYIVMEILKGGDLFNYLEKRKFKITEERASKITHSIAAAIYYCHEFGITHRDIKPENILLIDESENSDVKLVDFGLSKIIGPNEKCAEPFGTLSYVAPEVLKKELYGKSVDLWSIGILAYLLLVGYLPFDHENDSEIARQTVLKNPDFCSKYWINVSREGVNFCRRLLVKDKDKRMSIKEILTHKWILDFTYDQNVCKMRFEADTQSKEFMAFSTPSQIPSADKRNSV